MPVILGPDGPSLGGFVCPATIVQAELWKMGQLKPGDTRALQVDSRRRRPQRMEAAQDAAIAGARFHPAALRSRSPACSSAKHARRTGAASHPAETDNPVAVVYRRAGDKYLLVEYGPLVLDLNLRFRVHALMTKLQADAVPGILDLTPGIRSLQVHYDSRVLPLSKLMDLLRAAETSLPAHRGHAGADPHRAHAAVVGRRRAPSWRSRNTCSRCARTRPGARATSSSSAASTVSTRIEDVKRIVFDASYLVMGLGDVYLGAPVATPVDPRHRLVTTKYNPARTWTPENAVGIGGAYMCVYGMEGPGGYQFVGRTLQMWNRWRQTTEFADGKPWLLRFFDQVRFFPVSEAELLKIREDFPLGRYQLKIEEATFSLREYNQFLADNSESITAFKSQQQASFDAERERWRASGQADYASDLTVAEAAPDSELDLPENGRAIASHVAGNVWKVEVEAGAAVKKGDPLVIVESMKMEFAVMAPCDGQIHTGVLPRRRASLCRAGFAGDGHGVMAAGCNPANIDRVQGIHAASAWTPYAGEPSGGNQIECEGCLHPPAGNDPQFRDLPR